MTTYIALLRGINISGKNKVAMPLLKALFEELGFKDVQTYINSGNVTFSSHKQSETELVTCCETNIAARFGLKIPVAIISAKSFKKNINQAPAWWNSDPTAVNYAIFVIAPASVKEVIAAVGETKPEYETVGYTDEVIFLSAPRHTYNKARWSKIASTSANQHVTIRNAKTVNKLLLLSSH